MHCNKMNIRDLFKKQLCHKFIYNECLSFDESVKLAESMIGDGKCNLVCDNCEHTARFLKTGRKESEQVVDACFSAFNLLLTNVPKFLRSLVSSVVEILTGGLMELNRMKKELEKDEISQHNFEDLRTISKYKLFGVVFGWGLRTGILAAFVPIACGFGEIVLVYLASSICCLIFPVLMKNFAFWVVRKRNEKRFSYKSLWTTDWWQQLTETEIKPWWRCTLISTAISLFICLLSVGINALK